MNTIQWKTQLTTLVQHDALTFIYRHFSPLLFCFLVGHVLVDLCPNVSKSVKIALLGISLSVAALPSFIYLARRTFFKIDSSVFAIFYFLFVAYIFSCFGDAIEFTTHSSSARLSQTAWPCLFIVLCLMEFYICRRLQTFC